MDEVLEREPLLRAHSEGAIVGYWIALKREQHVVPLEVVGRGGEWRHTTHEHARMGCIVQLVIGAQLLVLERLPVDAERAEAFTPLRGRHRAAHGRRHQAAVSASGSGGCGDGVGGVGGHRVVEKVGDGGHGDHVPDVLRVLLVLERDADHRAVVVEGRPSRVARVDGGIDLNREQVGARVCVPLDLDAAHHSHRHRDALAALRVAHHGHLVLQRRYAPKGERRDARPEAVVVDGEGREIALVRDLDARRRVLACVARLAHLDKRRVSNYMCVRHDAATSAVFDGKPGAGRLLLRSDRPRQLRGHRRVHRVYLNHGFSALAAWKHGRLVGAVAAADHGRPAKDIERRVGIKLTHGAARAW